MKNVNNSLNLRVCNQFVSEYAIVSDNGRTLIAYNANGGKVTIVTVAIENFSELDRLVDEWDSKSFGESGVGEAAHVWIEKLLADYATSKEESLRSC